MRLLDLSPQECTDGEGARKSFRLLAGEESLTEYRFHTMTARHFFCKRCGIYPFHRKRVTDYFGINVFCLEDFDPSGLPVRQTSAPR